MYKSVDYAFPTSTYATQFGRAKEGCYLITTRETIADPGEAMGPFDSREDAIEFAKDMPAEWWPVTGEPTAA